MAASTHGTAAGACACRQRSTQFQKETRERYRVASITSHSEGPVLVDVDGGRAIDVSGSYGVNVCGYDTYKGFVDRGWARVKDLGPNVLGPVHPIIADVLPALKRISKKEEVSFHMSGTEAVMCAVRLCRFNTKRKLIVQFVGLAALEPIVRRGANAAARILYSTTRVVRTRPPGF